MIRTARTLYRYLPGALADSDSVALAETGATPGPVAALPLKVQKRLIHPLDLRRRRCDVLHLIDDDYAWGLPKATWKETVITCHDMMPFLLYDSVARAFPNRAGRYIFRRALENMARAARIVCVSEFTREAALRFTQCDPARVFVTPLGIEPAFREFPDKTRASAFRQTWGLDERPVVLHVGACKPYKNIDGLLATFARIRSAVPDAMLLKVGGAFSDEHNRQINELNIANAIVHTPSLAEPDLVTAYNAADLLLWPSHLEGFGWPVLEAMACGAPVVASNGGSLGEVAAGGAPLFAPSDIAGMADAAAAILTDPSEAGQWRAKGLAHAARYSWEATATAYAGHYRAVFEDF